MIWDVMVDLEGLSKYPDGVILSIAVIPFNMQHTNTLDELVKRGLYLKLNVQSQLDSGRTMDKETLKFWKEQDAEAKAILKPSPEDVTIDEMISKINEYLTDKYPLDRKRSFFWSRGIQYDFPLLQDAYRKADAELPFSSWNLQDSKTFVRTLTLDQYARYELEGGIPEGFIKHHALYDAALDIMRVQELVHKYYS